MEDYDAKILAVDFFFRFFFSKFNRIFEFPNTNANKCSF